MYAFKLVFMFFEDFSWQKALKEAEAKVVPYGRVVDIDNALFRNIFGALGFPPRAWHVIVFPIGSDRLNIMVRTVAATVACDLATAHMHMLADHIQLQLHVILQLQLHSCMWSSLSKLRELKQN